MPSGASPQPTPFTAPAERAFHSGTAEFDKLLRTGKAEEALEALKMPALFGPALTPEQRGALKHRTALGHLALGDVEGGERELLEGLIAAKSGPYGKDSQVTRALQYSYGQFLIESGSPHLAIPILSETIAKTNRVLAMGEDLPAEEARTETKLLAGALLFRGMGQARVGKLEGAVEDLEASHNTFKSIQDVDHLSFWRVTALAGQLHYLGNRLEKAVPFIEEAIELGHVLPEDLQEKILPFQKQRLAIASVELGNIDRAGPLFRDFVAETARSTHEQAPEVRLYAAAMGAFSFVAEEDYASARNLLASVRQVHQLPIEQQLQETFRQALKTSLVFLEKHGRHPDAERVRDFAELAFSSLF